MKSAQSIVGGKWCEHHLKQSVWVCVIAIATEKLPIFYTFFRCLIHLQITGSTFLFIEAIVK